MTEDSGAFKTNPGNSAQIGHFVIRRERAAKMPQAAKNTADRHVGAAGRPFYNKQVRDVEIFSNRPDSPCESSRFQ